jgi:DNA-binding HxlR family transcriptional regulator
MVEKTKVHFAWNEVKKSIIKFILESSGPVTEPAIREHLINIYGAADQGLINRQLHALKTSGCIEKVAPVKKSRLNYWELKKLKNLENILVHYPDFVGTLQNSELALKIIIDKHSSLITNANEAYLNKISKLKFEINECTERWEQHLKYSTDFFKMFLENEPEDLAARINILAQISGDDWSSSIYRVQISQTPGVDTLIYQNIYKIDLAFKACVSKDILQGQPTEGAIEYVKQLGDVVSDEQIEQWEKLYFNNRNNSEGVPSFFKGKKLIPVENPKLDEIEREFVANGGKFI